MITGLFGGTFNPVHYGHLRAAEEAVDALGLNKVLFIPAGVPPLKNSGLAPVEHRMRMVELAIQGNPRFALSALEAHCDGKSYTVDTIKALREESPASEFVFILGLDSFMDLPMWKAPDELLGLCDFLVLSRPGHEFSALEGKAFHDVPAKQLSELDSSGRGIIEGRLLSGRRLWLYGMPPLWVSSTGVRGLLSGGQSVRYLLPESVESYIMSHGLYRG